MKTSKRGSLFFILFVDLLILGFIEIGLRINCEALDDELFRYAPGGFVLAEEDPEWTAINENARKQNRHQVKCRLTPDQMVWLDPGAIDPEKFNVFLVGGSAMYGDGSPWDVTFQKQIPKLLPDTDDLRIYNCAMQAMEVRRVSAVVEDILLQYHPDMIIVYSGNNEFIHWYYPIRRRALGLDFSRLSAAMTRSYIYRALIAGHRLSHSDFPFHELDPQSDEYYRFFDASMCLERQYDDLKGFDPGRYAEMRQAVVNTYESYLRKIVKTCRAGSVPVVLTTVPINYRLSVCYFLRQPLVVSGGDDDLKPAKETMRTALDHIQNERFQKALELLEPYIASEPQAPFPRYLQAMALDGLGKSSAAREAYGQSRERVFGYLGSMLSINDSVQRVGQSESVEILDTRDLIEDEGEKIGDPYLSSFFVDYCHLSKLGMRITANEMARRIQKAMEAASVEAKE